MSWLLIGGGMWRNGSEGYGLIHILLHWLIALSVFGLFGLGVWMVSMDYYHDWYYKAPTIHQGVGILMAIALVLRLIWRFTNPFPRHISTHSPVVRYSSTIAHGLLYVILFVVIISGYMISTAKGKGIPVFDWFTVPGISTDIRNQADIAGEYHEWLAWLLVVLAAAHGLAAIKHHFVDKDETLKRMIKPIKIDKPTPNGEN